MKLDDAEFSAMVLAVALLGAGEEKGQHCRRVQCVLGKNGKERHGALSNFSGLYDVFVDALKKLEDMEMAQQSVRIGELEKKVELCLLALRGIAERWPGPHPMPPALLQIIQSVTPEGESR